MVCCSRGEVPNPRRRAISPRSSTPEKSRGHRIDLSTHLFDQTFDCFVMSVLDQKTLELLNLWGNPFYVDWTDPFRHPDDLQLFTEFAQHASRYEWEDVLHALKHTIERNVTDDEELLRDILDLAMTMYQLIPKSP